MVTSKRRWLSASTKAALVLAYTLAMLAPAFGQSGVKGMPANGDGESVTGCVTDQQGNPISGATVLLTKPAEENGNGIVTGENGVFGIATASSGFDLQISAPGFAATTIHRDPDHSPHLDLGTIKLRMLVATTEVIVSVTEEELAQEQVKLEEKQRIVGLVPNFLVTYDPRAVPLHARQKYELALRTMIDPETVAVDLASSGVQQAAGGLKGYGAGPKGFAKRFGASYGTGSMDTMLGSAVLPSLFKQDPRYFYKATGSVQQRALYAIGMSVLCKGDNGHWQYNYSGLLGGLAAGGISNLYAPRASHNDFGLTLQNTAIGIGSSAITNLLQEFVLRKLTRSAKQPP